MSRKSLADETRAQYDLCREAFLSERGAEEQTMAETHDPEAYLKEAYLGEIGGEATFLAWLDQLPGREASLRLLAEVEAATARYLKPHLMGEVSEDEVTQVSAWGRARALEMVPEDWPAMLNLATPIVTEAIKKFQAAEAAAPAELAAVYQHFTAHEQALADFLACELAGGDGDPILQGYLDATASAMQQAAASAR